MKKGLFVAAALCSGVIPANADDAVCFHVLSEVTRAPSAAEARRAQLDPLAQQCAGIGAFHFERARAYFGLGDLDGALAILESALKSELPDHRLEIRYLYAMVLLRKDDLDRALPIAKELETAGFEPNQTTLLLTDIYFRKADFAAARAYAQRALKTGHHDTVYPILIYSAYKLNDFDAAIEAFEESQKRGVPDALIYEQGNAAVGAAHSYYERGNYGKSAKVLTVQLRKVPQLERNPFILRLKGALAEKGFEIDAAAP
jgi:tetratricopeptide (TPR) repeat protein